MKRRFGVVLRLYIFEFFFFFNDTATTEIYTLSLHDALPISGRWERAPRSGPGRSSPPPTAAPPGRCSTPPRSSCWGDRKSTRLNSSHANISYAVFCLKKKKNNYHCQFNLLVMAYHHAP